MKHLINQGDPQRRQTNVITPKPQILVYQLSKVTYYKLIFLIRLIRKRIINSQTLGDREPSPDIDMGEF
jgi:hypothetical protein